MQIRQSSLLTAHGFRHGFSLRTGGVSEGAFASANLGRALGDLPEHVEENHRRLAAAVGYEQVFEVSQVHGAMLRQVRIGQAPEVVRQEEADGVFAVEPGVAVGIRVADCVPILMAVKGTSRVAAVHAGWRGVEAGIAGRAAVTILGGRGTEELLVAIGPHIRMPRFEVGEEVATRLEAVSYGADAIDRSRPKPHIDLAAIVSAQLHTIGVTQIDDVGGCTYDDSDDFFSYRRDDGTTGRHLAVVVG